MQAGPETAPFPFFPSKPLWQLWEATPNSLANTKARPWSTRNASHRASRMSRDMGTAAGGAASRAPNGDGRGRPLYGERQQHGRVGFQGLLVTSDGGLILVRESRKLWPQRNRSREIPKTERCPRKPIGHVADSGFGIRARADGKLFGAAGSALGRRLHRSGSKGDNQVYTHCCRETIKKIPTNTDWAGPEVGWHKQELGVQGIHRLRKNS